MSDTPKWLQRSLEFLIDNITILLTIGFAGYVIYRREVGQMAVTTDQLLTAILGVLGLLAISEIVERHRKLNSIEKSVKHTVSFLESRLAESPSAIAFFQRPPNLDSYIQSANQIDMCGVSLTTTLHKQLGNLRERLKEGAQIRLLVIDPDSIAVQMSAQRSESPDDVEYYRARLEVTLRGIEHLYKGWAEYQSLRGSSKAGCVAVRLLSYAPSFGIISFDANRTNGMVFVEVYPHKCGDKPPPMFELVPRRDGIWYGYFVGQFDEMWMCAKPWNPRTVSGGQHTA